MNKIKERIKDFLLGDKSISHIETLMSLPKEFIPIGIDNDADAVLIGGRIDKMVYVVGLVGRSIIQGEELRAYIEAYVKEDGGLESHVEQMTEYFYDGFKKSDTLNLILTTEGDVKWKSFNPLKNIDEVMTTSITDSTPDGVDSENNPYKLSD